MIITKITRIMIIMTIISNYKNNNTSIKNISNYNNNRILSMQQEIIKKLISSKWNSKKLNKIKIAVSFLSIMFGRFPNIIDKQDKKAIFILFFVFHLLYIYFF